MHLGLTLRSELTLEHKLEQKLKQRLRIDRAIQEYRYLGLEIPFNWLRSHIELRQQIHTLQQESAAEKLELRLSLSLGDRDSVASEDYTEVLVEHDGQRIFKKVYKQCKAAEGSFIDWSSPRGET